MNNKIPAAIKAFIFFILLLGVTLPLCALSGGMSDSTGFLIVFVGFFIGGVLSIALCSLPAAAIKWNVLQWLTPINDPSEEIRFKPVLRRTIYEILYLLFVMGITFLFYNFSDFVTFKLHALTDDTVLIKMIVVAYLLLCLPVSLIINFRLIGKYVQELSRFKKILMTFLFSILLPVLFALAFLIMTLIFPLNSQKESQKKQDHYTSLKDNSRQNVSQISSPQNKSADPNLGSFSGTLLYDAVMDRAKWKLEDIRHLLERGIDPNALNKNHESALSLACQQKDIAMIELLLEKGARPDIPGHSSNSPMWQAIVNDDVQMVRLLLDYGASPEFRPNASADAPLTTAVQGPGSRLEIIKLLLDHGADPNQDRLLFHAMDKKWLEVIRALAAKGANLNACANDNGDQKTPLIKAIGDVDMMRLLLDLGASAEAPCQYGYTPLIAAANSNRFTAAKLLLERGARADTRQQGVDSYYNAIYYAKQHSPELVILLLQHGADPNQDGLIFDAIYSGWLDVVKVLVERGADLNVRSRDGSTPLQHAQALKRNEIAAYLRIKMAVKK